VRYLEVDKSWNGIHYLLTGLAEGGSGPLSLTVLGGAELGGDLGYGPARFLMPAQVVEVASALSSTPQSVLAGRFEPKAMARAGVYPQAMWVRDGAGALEYVLGHYARLVEFYARAAKSGSAVVLWLS
jgi:hypothetical protein